MSVARYPTAVYRLARLAGQPVRRALVVGLRGAWRDVECWALGHEPNEGLAAAVGSDRPICDHCLKRVDRERGR